MEPTTTLREALQDYGYVISKLSKHTQVWYQFKLDKFCSWCEENKITLDTLKAAHINKFMDYLTTYIPTRTKRPLSSEALHGYARAIRAFVNWMSNEEDYEKLVSSRLGTRIAMPRKDNKIIETLTNEDIKRLFVACDREASMELRVRDRAILSVLLDTGIRLDEIINLTLDNVHLGRDDSYIKVLGKGRKEREVGLGVQASRALHRYISRHRQAEKGVMAVFTNRFHRQCTPNGINQTLYRLAEWAKIEGRVSAHVWRHTYSVNYLNNGGDVYKLSRLLGHNSITVTEVYLRAVKAKDARHGLSVLDQLK